MTTIKALEALAIDLNILSTIQLHEPFELEVIVKGIGDIPKAEEALNLILPAHINLTVGVDMPKYPRELIQKVINESGMDDVFLLAKEMRRYRNNRRVIKFPVMPDMTKAFARLAKVFGNGISAMDHKAFYKLDALINPTFMGRAKSLWRRCTR